MRWHMHAKTSETKEMNPRRQGLEEWISAGNRLHDRAIFDFFARLLPTRRRSMKPETRTVESAGRVKWMHIKPASRVIT